MAKTYAQLLKQGTDQLLEIASVLKNQGPSGANVRRLKYIAGFLGLQKISDLGFWLEDWLDASGPKLSPMEEPVRDLFCNLMTEVLLAVDAPLEFGEFVNAESIALRPLFKKEIPIHQLFSLLKEIHPIQFQKRNIFKLPVSVQEAYPYSLRLPSRFLERADLDSYLALLYVDLGRSKREDWTAYGDLLQRLVREGIILYQGAMEVSWEFLRSRKPLLPYYLLYAGEEEPRDFLQRHGFSGHVMRMLKRPGEPWSSQGQTLEGTEEEFWDIYDLESGDLTQNHSRKSGDGLLAAATRMKELSPAKEIPSPPPVREEIPPENFSELPEDSFTVIKESTAGDFPLREPEEKKTLPPIHPGEKLMEIPFTLDDLENPRFSWPSGMDGLSIDLTAPRMTPPPVPEPEEERGPEPGSSPSAQTWMPEIRAPLWEDHAEELSESEELLRTKKSHPFLTFLGITLIAVFSGMTGYLGWTLFTQAGSSAYSRGKEASFLYGQMVEKILSGAEVTANLFIPSVEGMAPELVTKDFFDLFYPEQTGVSGFGTYSPHQGLGFYSPKELSPGVSTQLDRLTAMDYPTPQAFLPLEGSVGQTVWIHRGEEGSRKLWLLSWADNLPMPAKDQGLLILSQDGNPLFRSGSLWQEWPDFTFPLSSFPQGVSQGPLNYQDVNGRQVVGGFYRSPRGLVICVVQKPQAFQDLLVIPQFM